MQEITVVRKNSEKTSKQQTLGPPKNQPFGRIIQVMPMVGMVGGESAKLHNHSNQTVSTVARSPKHHKKQEKNLGPDDFIEFFARVVGLKNRGFRQHHAKIVRP